MGYTASPSAVVSGDYTTTDDSWHTVCSWSVASFSNHYPGMMYGTIQASCRKTDNSDCAYWDQPIAISFTDTSAELANSLPSLLSSFKPLALLACDIGVTFDDEVLNLRVKGLNNNTLKWGICFNMLTAQCDM